LAASALLLFGCPNPNTYTTPRTIGSRHFQGSAALEVWGLYVPATSTATGRSAQYLTNPTLSLRLGLGDAWESGARIGNMSSLGGDLKWNFLRSRRIDLAIDPAFQVMDDFTALGGNGQIFTYVHVPLLVGVNLTRAASLVFTPGLSWGFTSSGALRFTDGPDQGTRTGTIERLGIGADFRVRPGFALHPEITLLRAVGGDDRIQYFYVAGLGFNFGAMPNYDDVGGSAAPGNARAAPESPQ